MTSPTCPGRRALVAALMLVAAGSAAGAPRAAPPVEARLELEAGGASPFPADWLTTPDRTQRTGLRVALPLPRCAVERSACDDVRLLQELDGFDLDPRLAVRFTGPIDLASVTPRSVFLIRLVAGPSEVTGLDRVVWDGATQTLYARPESLLEPETRYGLVVTRELRDAGGRPVQSPRAFQAFMRDPGGPPAQRAYRTAMAQLGRALARRGVRESAVVTASVFTTGSVSAFLEHARDALERRAPPPAAMTAPEQGGRAWFPRATLARLVLRRQVATSTAGPDAFQDRALPLEALPADAVSGVGIGWYWSPSYLNRDRRIVEGPSLTPLVELASHVPVPFVVVLPAGPRPAGGWPLALFGHGYGGEMLSSALLAAGSLARHGIATAAISVVGHGGGPESRLLATLAEGRTLEVRVPGRGVDLNADGRIDPTEGLTPLAGGPLAALSLRDGLRQQVVDLMALVRAIGPGLDVDGDGSPDTGSGPLFYAGQSLGGIYGTIFLAVEPRVRVGVLNVPGGPLAEIARLSPVFRPLVKDALARRVPSLLNLDGDFREDFPIRGDTPVVDPASGALGIQDYLARAMWLGRRGDPLAYAPHLRRAPLPGVDPARVLVQFALDDPVVPNPTTRALVRAGALGDRAVLLRTDLVVRATGRAWPDPHTFLLATGAPDVRGQIARAAQDQIARFFRDDGEGVEIPRVSLRLGDLTSPFELAGDGGPSAADGDGAARAGG